MKPLIAIAISGGIDSLMTAYLLKEQGHSIIGIHFITGYEVQPSVHKKKQVLQTRILNYTPTSKPGPHIKLPQ